MYYTIYRITNQINGKIYIGSHKTKDLNDSYMGSGKYLKHAQNKYGIEKFTKEVLFVFDSSEAMYAKEAEIVNEEFLSEENTYNLKVGGFGGWDYINSTITKEERLVLCSLGGLTQHMSSAEIGKRISVGKLKSDKRFNGPLAAKEKYPNGTFHGRTHSEETKQKIKISVTGNNIGDKNSQFGSMWVTNGLESKKIKKTDPLPEGFKKGRKMILPILKFGVLP
jgi:hypothetical protein